MRSAVAALLCLASAHAFVPASERCAGSSRCRAVGAPAAAQRHRLQSTTTTMMAQSPDGEPIVREVLSDDPLVMRLEAEVAAANGGKGLDSILNPAKLINLEREILRLREELEVSAGWLVHRGSRFPARRINRGPPGARDHARLGRRGIQPPRCPRTRHLLGSLDAAPPTPPLARPLCPSSHTPPRARGPRRGSTPRTRPTPPCATRSRRRSTRRRGRRRSRSAR